MALSFYDPAWLLASIIIVIILMVVSLSVVTLEPILRNARNRYFIMQFTLAMGASALLCDVFMYLLAPTYSREVNPFVHYVYQKYITPLKFENVLNHLISFLFTEGWNVRVFTKQGEDSPSHDRVLVGILVVVGYYLFNIVDRTVSITSENLVKKYVEKRHHRNLMKKLAAEQWMHTELDHIDVVAEDDDDIEEVAFEFYDNESEEVESAEPDEEKLDAYEIEAEQYYALLITHVVCEIFHNVLDGVALGVGFLGGWSSGFATGLAIVLHEIPQAIISTCIFSATELPVPVVMLLHVMSAAFTLVGVFWFVLLHFFEFQYLRYLEPIIAGNFIYVAATIIVPLIHVQQVAGSAVVGRVLQVCGTLFGIGLMVMLDLLE
jgi:zinc transporter ZupT